VKRRLVLFDIDGTLLLSGGAGRRAILGALHDETGRDPAGAMSVRFDGKTDPQIVVELFAAVGHPEPYETDHIERVLERYLFRLRADLAVNASKATVMPGIRPLLDRLEQDDRLVLGLLTGNIKDGAEIKLKSVELAPERFLVGAYGSDHAVRAALPPIAVDRARPLFGRPLHGDEIVIIGDTPADITCGQCVSARAIGVGTGAFSPAELLAVGAMAAFDDLSDIDRAYHAIVGDLE
jgi:phosphoglycolate phosphatase-like HAD superfamily hydrolase